MVRSISSTTRLAGLPTILMLVYLVGTVEADFTFGTPTNLGPTVNSSNEDFNASISADGLSLYFISSRPGGVGMRDIWVTTRETTDEDWGEPVNLGPTINTPVGEWGVSISSDGLSLYFDTSQNGSVAINDLWVATRATIDDDWGNPVSLGPTVNSSGDDYDPSISSDNLSLYFHSNRPGGYGNYDIWATTRATTEDDWGEPVNLGPTVNTSVFDIDPGISADGLMLFFIRVDGQTETDIWMTRRATTNDDWGEPVNLGSPINSSAFERYPNVSADGSTLFFRYSQSDPRSGGDIWQAPIIPIVDFNGNGMVDTADVCIMADYWSTDEPLCDIGPMPWGDGIVDAQDMEVLMSYWQQEILPVELVAYWKLDEAEGTIAYDSVGTNDGTLMGVPAWQPDGGQVDGALEFDGMTFVVVGPVLSPSDGPLSVFAWVQGGAPGQVIVSQGGGADWLMADTAHGALMTGLSSSQSRSPKLISESVVIDGNWHRVALVCDGSTRALYVDAILVAEDTQKEFASSEGGLHIGCGSDQSPDSFFSGLIDDVRIYNRAVRP